MTTETQEAEKIRQEYAAAAVFQEELDKNPLDDDQDGERGRWIWDEELKSKPISNS